MFFKELSLIGRVLEVSKTNKSSRIIATDNTGVVELSIMHKDFESMPMWVRKIEVDKYYKIFGQARAFKDKKSVNTFSASMITDFNELTHHFLSVILNKAIREKGVLSPIEIKEGKRRIQESNEESKDSNEKSADISEEVQLTPSPPPIQLATPTSTNKEIQNSIIQTMWYLDAHKNCVSKEEVYKKLPLRISMEKFENAFA